MSGREYIIAKETLEPGGERLFWSNVDGWVDRANATIFTWNERYRQKGEGVSLPAEGCWWVIS